MPSRDSDFTLRSPASGDSNLNCGNNRCRIPIPSHFSLGVSNSHTTRKNRFFFQSRFCDRFDSLPFKSLGLKLSQINFWVLSDHKKRETNFNKIEFYRQTISRNTKSAFISVEIPILKSHFTERL